MGNAEGIVLSAALSRAVAELSPSALVMVDAEGAIVFVNHEAETLFGYARGELLGRPIEHLVPERFRPGHPAERGRFLTRPQARRMGAARELYGLRKDGTEFPTEIGLRPIHTDEGLFVLSAVVDLTTRKRLEQRFRRAVESAPTAMIMMSAEGTIVLANTAAERMFGYDKDELLRQPVESLVPMRLRDRHPALRADFLRQPLARPMGVGRDLFAVRKDGTEFPVEIGLNPVDTEDGVFVIGAVVDITERTRQLAIHERLTAELKRSNEALEQSNVDLRQFAYAASHDLQTPLRGIAGSAQILERRFGGELNAEAHDLIRRIVDGTRRMQSMIDDLLQCSRVESRARPLEPVEIDQVVADVLDVLQTSMLDAGATVRIGELPCVLGDRAQLLQLFQNLIGNAIKYHGEAPPIISIDASRAGQEWVLSVADNGIGIAAEHHDAIFEIFRRLHTQRSYPGTGIGLALCRRVVHHHGGRIWVESAPGRGSIFRFTLKSPD